jgi:hypothetical protein
VLLTSWEPNVLLCFFAKQDQLYPIGCGARVRRTHGASDSEMRILCMASK